MQKQLSEYDNKFLCDISFEISAKTVLISQNRCFIMEGLGMKRIEEGGVFKKKNKKKKRNLYEFVVFFPYYNFSEVLHHVFCECFIITLL